VPIVHRLQGVTALSMRIFTHSISPGRSRLERRRVQPPRSVRFALKSCSNSINRQGTAACCAFETWGDVSCRSLSGHCRSRRPDRKRIALRRRSRPSVRAIVETAVTDQRRTLDGGRRSTTWECPARVCARRSPPTFGEKPPDSRPALLVGLPQAQEETEPATLTRVRSDADDRR
jgi:hypothetical protein